MAAHETVQGHRKLHRDRQIKEVVHDPYQERYKPEGNAFCPGCGVIFARGRWAWGARAQNAQEHTCPACRRIQDSFPAGYVTLKGEFVVENLDMLLALIRNEESRAKSAHPLERIIQIAVKDGAITVTTTDMHLPQRIGQALQSAYHGHLEIQRTPDDYQTRVNWER